MCKDILIYSSFTYCPASQGLLAFLSTTISVIELWIFMCSVEGILRFSSKELQTWWEILSAKFSCEEPQDDRHSPGMPGHQTPLWSPCPSEMLEMCAEKLYSLLWSLWHWCKVHTKPRGCKNTSKTRAQNAMDSNDEWSFAVENLLPCRRLCIWWGARRRGS